MERQGIYFDIDGTLTTHLLGYHPVGYFEFVLAGMLCMKQTAPLEALDRVCQAEESVEDADPFLAAKMLNVDVQEYKNELMRYQKKYLLLHKDTLFLVDYCITEGIPVYITTNNTKVRAETILEFLGLSRNIQKIYTPQITGARKNSPFFWRYVIADTKIPGKYLAVTGDEELSDSRLPLKAGFGISLLLPEKQERGKLPEDWLVQKIKND